MKAEQKHSKARNYQLDVLKLIFAVLVIISHTDIFIGQNTTFAIPNGLGWMCVHFFFTVSGLLMVNSFMSHPLNNSSQPGKSAMNFVIKKFMNSVFKSITADNGSEFGRMNELKDIGIAVFFTHPYSSFEKGINECHNRMLRWFIRKGKSIAEYSQTEVSYFADLINGLPRKLLGYSTPETIFEQEIDRIYALSSAI